jgi:GNAT superfamily N-acetyltransferase
MNINSLLDQIKNTYPDVAIYAKEYSVAINLNYIKVPEAYQNKGIGSKIIEILQEYATNASKAIVIELMPQKGKILALKRFYKRHGFVPNSGNYFVVSFNRKWTETWYWRPFCSKVN